MGYSKGVSLPQLTEDIVVNARKTRLDAFAVALEGWRRGLKLKWYTKDSNHFDNMIVFGVNPPGRLFSLSSNEKTHYFFRTRGDKVTNEAVELAADKGITKEILANRNIPVPEGKGFSEEATDEEIIEFSKTLTFPLVCKPTDASLGMGVVTNISSNEEFMRALHYIRHELEYGEVIVEQHVQGKEYRLYVIENEVVAAYNRIPANITGDGEHTIEELIELKNFERRKNSRLNSCLINVDKEIIEFIAKKGYRLSSVPQKGEYLLLREKTNISIGGDPIDVTDEISDEMKQIAIQSINAIPGLYHAGVDIINDVDEDGNSLSYVIEINATAQIGGILYPLKGKARNIPKAIIDYYFPETKGIDTTNSKIYFDMSTILEPMENRSALEVEVTPAPLDRLYAKQYTVIGKVQKESYHNWLKQKALRMGLHGSIEKYGFDQISIIVAGTDRSLVNNFKSVIKGYPKSSKVKKIRARKWREPITVGFEIVESFNIKKYHSTQNALRVMEREFVRVKKRENRLEKDINHVINSRSWKLTSFLRNKNDYI